MTVTPPSEKWNIINEYRITYSKISGVEEYEDLKEKFDLLIVKAQDAGEIPTELQEEIEAIIKINFRRVIKSRCEDLKKTLDDRKLKRTKLHDVKQKIKKHCIDGEDDQDFFDYFNLLSSIKDIEEEVNELKIIEKYTFRFNIICLIAGFILGIIASIVGYFILKGFNLL